MADNVIPFGRSQPISTNLQCKSCKSEWFEAIVVVDRFSHRVVGRHATLRCRECKMTVTL